MKVAVKNLFRKIGLEVNRLNTDNSWSCQIARAIGHFNIRTIYDIGANTGQYASEVFEFGYPGRIISFEPLTIPHRKLQLNANGNPRWHVHENCALGSRNEYANINVSQNSVSSSILPILDAHVESSKDSKYIDCEKVKVITFDSIFLNYFQGENSLLKIDTQGFEDEVLKGALSSLPKITLIQCELSLVPLYADQKLFMEMHSMIEALGFKMWSIRSGFTSNKSGRTLQVDAIYVNVKDLD